ncbi:MAG: hypothetical protein MT490_16380 [Sphingomonas sp.]|uniref:CheR family methyltransferase n=1 Tax=Sphingomonas sp. TaxID=28214 RepID=UPI002275222F|nr:CheR family methyltransferase [Sphingomonas sp.]MCX8477366.1 hypothetical protein [Sphingomonas sp.]
MTHELGDREVRDFQDLVELRLGLRIEDARLGFLAELLRRRLDSTGIEPAAYLNRFGSDWTRGEIGALARELTVPETYFFRGADQFRALAEIALPGRLAVAGGRELRILSAGCASGEEAYSIAIVAREAAAGSVAPVSIQAVDINPAVIRKAQRARFTNWAFRETAPDMRARWFRRVGAEFQLDDGIRGAVAFHERNLIDQDPEFWRPGSWDIVFCRNTIMYFPEETARAVVARIAGALAPGGYLFLGHAETLRGLSHDFHLRHTHGAFYYQRKERNEAAADPSAPGTRRVSSEPPVEAESDWIADIGRAAKRIETLAGAPSPHVQAEAVSAPRADYGAALDLLARERFAEALELVEAFPPRSLADPDILLLHATLLVHAGQLDAAERACRSLLGRDDMSAGAHHVLALCREVGGDRRGAIEQYQIAAYLDPSFAMPHLHLGLLARRAGDAEEAQCELGMAFELLQREETGRLLLFGGGFGRDALLALCRTEPERCGEDA